MHAFPWMMEDGGVEVDKNGKKNEHEIHPMSRGKVMTNANALDDVLPTVECHLRSYIIYEHHCHVAGAISIVVDLIEKKR